MGKGESKGLEGIAGTGLSAAVAQRSLEQRATATKAISVRRITRIAYITLCFLRYHTLSDLAHVGDCSSQFPSIRSALLAHLQVAG